MLLAQGCIYLLCLGNFQKSTIQLIWREEPRSDFSLRTPHRIGVHVSNVFISHRVVKLIVLRPR